MKQPPPTPLQLELTKALERSAGITLAEYVAACRADDRSWQWIADQIKANTGHTVTSQSLWGWFK